MKKSPVIVLTGGGSGGHITPLVSLGHALRAASPGCHIAYIGLKGDELETKLRGRYSVFDEVQTIQAGKFRRYHGESVLAHLLDIKTLLLNIRDLFRTFVGLIEATKILGRLKPDVVFSKGGFVVVPVGLAAHWRKIPIVTHDSDIVPGLANKLVGRYASVKTTGMPAEHESKLTNYVGIPLDERINPVNARDQANFKKQLGLPVNSLVLLVGGAGLGSRSVNDMVLQIAPELLERFKNLHIIHLSGLKHENGVSAKYRSMHHSQRVMNLGFTTDFYKYTGAADLIITRAGATTIAELAVQRKAVVLVPAPHLTGGHQIKNAQKLMEQGAAVVISDESKPDKLLEATEKLLRSKPKREKLAKNLGALAKADAADKLAETIIKVADGG